MQPPNSEHSVGQHDPESVVGCDKIAELIPAYSLGALDPEERSFVERHLAQCPGAARELAQYAILDEPLLYSVPPVAAPPAVLERLRTALAQTAGTPQTTSGAGQTGSALDRDRPPGFAQWWRWFSQPRWRISPLLAACFVLLLVGFGLYWNQQLKGVHTLQDQLAEQLEHQVEFMVLVGAGNAQRVELPPATGSPSTINAAVVLDPERTEAFLYVEEFPMLPNDQIYQLWLIQGDIRTSGGVFQVDEEGNGVLYIEAPEPLGAYDAIGITPEPVGGSPGPTAPPIVRANLPR